LQLHPVKGSIECLDSLAAYFDAIDDDFDTYLSLSLHNSTDLVNPTERTLLALLTLLTLVTLVSLLYLLTLLALLTLLTLQTLLTLITLILRTSGCDPLVGCCLTSIR
jgi:hypothetical protein